MVRLCSLARVVLAGSICAGFAATATAETDDVHVLQSGGAYLGVVLEDVDESAAERLGVAAQRGARIEEVEEDSPAAQAGLEKDDVVLAFDGERVRSTAHLSRLVRETPPGRSVEIEVIRAGQSRTLTATVKDGGVGRFMRSFKFTMPDFEGLEFDTPHVGAPHVRMFRHDGSGGHGAPHGPSGLKLGIRYQELSDQLAQYFGAEQGVLVTHVEPGSAAERAGVRAGDVLQHFAGQPVPDGRHLQRALRDADAGEAIELEVLRRGESHALEVTLDARSDVSHGETF